MSVSCEPKTTTLAVGIAEADAILRPCSSYQRLLLAVSGGPDSMALMHLVVAWSRRAPQPKPTLLSVTVDHGLRPEARHEARWVGTAARKLQLVHHVLTWDEPKPSTGVQAAARAARFRLLVTHAIAKECDAIVLAHTEDDQAETMLMRLARGSGVDGLSAMQAIVPLAHQQGAIDLVRPLLGIPKSRLVATLQAHGLASLDDPSNTNQRFERVRLRAARPVLDQLGLSAPQLARTARRVGRARAALDNWTETILEREIELHGGIGAQMGSASFFALPDEIALRTLQRLVWAHGGQTMPPRLLQLESLLCDLRAGQTAATLGGCEVRVTQRCLIVLREWGRTGLPSVPLVRDAPTDWDRRYRIEPTGHTDAVRAFTPDLIVRALGPDGLRQLLAAAKNAGLSGTGFAYAMTTTPVAAAPRRAWRTLPAVWFGNELRAVPSLQGTAAALEGCLPLQSHYRCRFTAVDRLKMTTVAEESVS